jgi:hypothetical protein
MMDPDAHLPLKDRLRTYIEETDHVSFAELCNRFGEMRAPRGEGAELVKGENVVLWSGLTDAAVDALIGLLDAGEVVPVPTVIMVYLADGGMLNLPLLKRAPGKRGLSKPHWLPVVLRPAGRATVERKRGA